MEFNTCNSGIDTGNALFGTNKYTNVTVSATFGVRRNLSHGMKNPYADAVCSDQLF